MGDDAFLHSIGLILVAGAVFALLLRRLFVPTIVTYLIAGLFLGPMTGLVELTHTLDIISEFGIALLLFLVGLELSLEKIKDVGAVAVAAGIGQVVFTAAGGMVIALILGFNMMESIFLATALTFSSTVVVVKLLDQKGDLDSLYGRIAVGIFLVQDLVVIVALTFLAGLGEAGADGVEAAEITVDWWELAKAFGGMGLLLVLTLGASRYLLPKPFAWAARSPEMLFIWSLTWCLGLVLLAEYWNLSLEIGAFLAGLSLAQLPYNDDLRRRVHPLMNFFLAIFFVSLGIKMDFSAALDHSFAIIILSLFVLIGNPLIFMIIISKMGYGERTSFFTSVTVAQISEFSFIFVTMGVAAGLVGGPILSITALVGLVTIVLSAYMILYNEPLYRFVRKLGLLKPFKARCEDDDPEEEHGFKDHIIIIGMNSLGRDLVRRFCESGRTVLAIDTDPNKLEGLPCHTMIGSVEYRSALEEAGLPRARLLISALQIEETNYLLAHYCKEARVPAAIHAFDLSLIDELIDQGVTYLLTPKIDGVKMQVRKLKEEGIT